MSADQYDELKKTQLQRIARVRGLDPNGTVAELRERLREQDAEASEEVEDDDEDLEAEEAEEDDEDDDEDSDEDEEEEEFEGGDFGGDDEDEEPAPAVMALANPGEELKEGYFRFTVHAGNNAFFLDPMWHAANEELALLEAGRAGYKYLRSMGEMEYLMEGNSVHYQFPVERL